MHAKGAKGLPGGTSAACAASHRSSAPPLLALDSVTSECASCAATWRASVLSVSSAAAPWGPSLAASNACAEQHCTSRQTPHRIAATFMQHDARMRCRVMQEHGLFIQFTH